MAFPAGVVLRVVSFGSAIFAESGETIEMRVNIRASRSMVWLATGTPVVNLGASFTSSDGVDRVLSLPVTDQSGWGDGAGGAITLGVGEHTHSYTASVEYYVAGIQRSTVTIGPFVLPAGAGVVDIDNLVPAGSTGGAVVSLPDIWSQQIADLNLLYVSFGDMAPDPADATVWADTSGATPVMRGWDGDSWESISAGGGALTQLALSMPSVAPGGLVPIIITQPGDTATDSPEMAQFMHSGDKTFWLNEWGAPRVRIPSDKNADAVFKGYWFNAYTGVPFQLSRDGSTTVYQFSVHADGSWSVAETGAPSAPPSGMHRFYPKADGHLYSKDDASVERQITPAAPAQYLLFHPGTTAYVLSPLTAGTVEPGNQVSARTLVDLANAKQIRITVGQRIVGAGGTSCDMKVQYATDGATQSTWADASAASVSLQGGTANIMRSSGWVNLVPGAQINNCYLRLVTVIVGTVTTAPSWYKVQIEVR